MGILHWIHSKDMEYIPERHDQHPMYMSITNTQKARLNCVDLSSGFTYNKQAKDQKKKISHI